MSKRMVLVLVVLVFLVCIAFCGAWFVWDDNLGEGEDVIQSWPTWTPTRWERVLPSPTLVEGEACVVGDLSVAVLEHEFGGCWITAYGNQVCPSEGMTYLWVRLRREHLAENTQLPLYTCFWSRLVCDAIWFVPGRYGVHYPGRQSWGEGGCKLLYAGYSDEGWLGFEVPDDIDLARAVLEVTSYKVPKLDRQWVFDGG